MNPFGIALSPLFILLKVITIRLLLVMNFVNELIGRLDLFDSFEHGYCCIVTNIGIRCDPNREVEFVSVLGDT